jgi:hypothetical protein
MSSVEFSHDRYSNGESIECAHSAMFDEESVTLSSSVYWRGIASLTPPSPFKETVSNMSQVSAISDFTFVHFITRPL